MKKIEPEIGEVNLGKHNIITSYYEQNQAEALPAEKQVIDFIYSKAPDWSQQKVRSYLGSFGFQNNAVFKNVQQLNLISGFPKLPEFKESQYPIWEED